MPAGSRILLWTAFLMLWISPAGAQYMRLTTDNPTDNTRLRRGVTNVVTVTLDTNHDKSGAVQTCNSHTSLNCGGPTSPNALDMFSYTIALKAVGGTVTWGTFSAADANYSDISPQIQSTTEVELNKARPTGTFTPPGLATLGTIPVTILSGNPTVQVQVGASGINPFGFGTGFGTECDAFGFANTYVVGDITDPCGVANGIPGDWFDWDGVTTATIGNIQPSITAPATASAAEGTAMSPLNATATDADAANTLTLSQTGMPSDLTFTTNSPGPTPRTASILGTPGFTDAGSYNIVWTVDDGAGAANSTNSTTTVLTIANTNRAPTLNVIANMTLPGCSSSTADQPISGSDPDGDFITFSKVAGPTYMTVTTTSPTTGNIHLAPSASDPPSQSPATVRASDGSLSQDQSFTITITGANRPPVLTQPANMTVNAGATSDQTLTASDPCGNALFFAKTAGPTFMSVTTTNAGTGAATGNVHLAPGAGDAGSYTATVQASDGTLTDSKSFTVSVGSGTNHPPTLDPVANMNAYPGCGPGTTDQPISGSDPDGDALTFSKVAGPTFMTVTTTSPTTGNIHLAVTPAEPLGTSSATVRASDGTLNSDRSFTITVSQAFFSPVLDQPANMTVNPGATADQTLRATDACGAPLTFSKVSGPTFITVTTTSQGSFGVAAMGNLHLAPGAADVGTYFVTVSAGNGTLNNQKSLSVAVTADHPPTLNTVANMTVPPGATLDQAISGTDPDGDALTFSLAAGPPFVTVTTTSPTTGNVHVAPPLGASGTFAATARASDGVFSATRNFSITVCLGCVRAPVLAPVSDMTVTEGMTADQAVSATDPDGMPLTFSKATGPVFMTVTTTDPGAGSATGNIHLAPGLADAGVYSASVRASNVGLFAERTFTITALTSGNRCPTANPGGPYSGLAGVPVGFDGSASSDPDGNPLTYAWDFDASNGITVDATGVQAAHVYATAGTFVVTLTVTDNGDGDPAQICSNSATTTATISAACPATVFNGYDTIRLGSGKPFWFAYVQPALGCYVNSDVIVSSFVMKYAGRVIGSSGKSSVGGDKSGDGIAEIKTSFGKDAIRALFTGTGLANGHNMVTVTLEADLVTGGKLSGTTVLDVVNNGNFTAATVAPNPLNPEAVLTYVTSRPSAVRIDLFNIQGRLVRRLVDDPAMAAGTHETIIDGRGSRGEKLPSGVYYIRGTSAEGEFKQLVTILK